MVGLHFFKISVFYIYLFFCATGVWTQDLKLARQALYHFSHAPAFFFIFLIFMLL
jgi:hypothetical protein